MSRIRKRQNLGWYLVASILVSGMIPFFIYEDLGRSAWPSAFEKAYLLTATFFGVLFYGYWQSIRRSWFWKALVPIVPAHSVVALVVIRFILAASPGINQYPGSIYGSLLSLVYGEVLVANRIIEYFRRMADRSRQ
jgi:peptidoglycan/LPS O-acetylase OafA/YrhL